MKEAKQVYERISDQFEDFTSHASQRGVEVDTFRYMVGNVQGLDILDLACGQGFFSRQLKDWGAAHVRGVDFSPSMIYQARQANDGIAYEVRDVTQMGRIGSYDKVTAAWLFNYASSVEDLGRMFSAAAQNLKPGGHLVAYTANPAFDLNKGNFTRYGISVLAESAVDGGFRCKAQFMSTPPADFTYYRWRQDVYEDAAKAAGFSDCRWIAPLISKQRREARDPGYWDEFESNSLQIGLICRK
ncbi:class I SAM-dependent methyltransferase [Pseudomonas sp. 2835]|uniref:class I SAM-dependent methyltransferase n=1 Tax=Pseudomonas sp. 2835 TaxID=3156451 RepID=UPI003D1BC36F